MTAAATDRPVAKTAEIRALRQDLVAARDEQIRKVVAMVDAMPDRGQADALIAPLRPRLAQLQMRRPINFGRLLFMPFNPVIVPGPQWRRDSLAIPRTALPSFIAQIAAARPELAAKVTLALAGATTDDRHIAHRIGPELWSEAAAVLAEAPVPARWNDDTGLSPADHALIRRALVLVFAQAPVISKLVRKGEVDPAVITAILNAGNAAGPDPLGLLISVLLFWVPGAAVQVLSVTSAHSSPLGAPGRAASERAVEFVLDRIENTTEIPSEGPVPLDRLRRTVALLDELTAQSADKPTRNARISATRAKVDAACRVRFETALQQDVVNRLELAPGGLPAEMESLEVAARDLRRFENVARRVNGSDHYDKLLRRVVTQVAPRKEDDAASRIDRLRLAEILLGPEQALAMLNAISPGAAPG